MKKNLWIALKRDKIWADLYYQGKKIATIRVSEQNRGNLAVLSIDNEEDLYFKIVKEEKDLGDESRFNREENNK